MSELKALTALYESTRAIGLQGNLEDLLDEVLNRAQRLIGFEHCALMLYDEETDVLRVARARGYGSRAPEVKGLALKPGQGLSGWAVAHRQAVRVGDVNDDPRYVAGLQQAQSNLAVPLIVQNRVVGVVNVESERPHAFTLEHQKLLTVLGAQAALAIIAQQAHNDLTQRIRHLGVLNQISLLASQGGNLGVTLNAMLEITEDVIPESHLAILLLDERQGRLRVEAGQGYKADVRYLQIPIGKGVTGRCAATGQPEIVGDVRELPGDDYIVGVPGARSEIAVPMEVDGTLIGVLNAESMKPHAFTDIHLQTLLLIARQAAGVISSARLQQETRRLSITDSLTGLYNRRHFSQQLEATISRATRYDERFALIIVDVDHFKAVNDRYGHPAGDLALEVLAQILADSLRESDLTARIGGEEFAILLIRTEPAVAETIAERLRRSIQDLVIEGESAEAFGLSASIGIGLFPVDGQDAKSLMRAADRALYRAKQQGRNRVELASVATSREGSEEP